MSRDSRLLLEDVLDAASRIRSYLEGRTRPTLDEDLRTRDAVFHNLEVIGEAVKKLPRDLLARHPAIDWSGFARMRDIVSHQYFRVDLDIVWQAVTDEMPGLESAVRALLKEAEDREP
jgi:uncharacterized protein with HEPN domain